MKLAGISFMGKDWDNFSGKPARNRLPEKDAAESNGRWLEGRGTLPYGFSPDAGRTKKERDAFIAFMTEVMTEALRVLKPGAHALVWALPRTSHWTATALEDAGFEIRDCVYHLLGTDAKVQQFLASLSVEQCNALQELLESQSAPAAMLALFGSGFPKSLDVSKAIDKINGKHLIDLSEFGNYIRSQRQAKGYSLAQLDEIMGTNTAASWWEGRKIGVQLPSLETYHKLKTVLDLNNRFDELIDWAEAEREVIGKDKNWGKVGTVPVSAYGEWDITAPATPEAQQWAGYGTALKPAVECWWLVRKPLSERNIAENVLKWGTGAINVDGCRVATRDVLTGSGSALLRFGGQNSRPYQENFEARGCHQHPQGRFPSHLLLSHTLLCTENECFEGCPIRELSRQSGMRKSVRSMRGNLVDMRGNNYARAQGASILDSNSLRGYTDQGTSARFFQQFHPTDSLDSQSDMVPFFYAAKASRAERNRGCEGLLEHPKDNVYGDGLNSDTKIRTNSQADHGVDRGGTTNNHPTVKSLQLMRYLVRLITPPGGIVLDCFAGSGSTLVAAVYEGMHFVGIDQSPEYVEIARCRVQYALQEVGCG